MNMTTEVLCYQCVCVKCQHVWVTKTHTLPKACSSCQSRGWQGKSVIKLKPVTAESLLSEMSAKNRLAVFNQFELCCGMNRGACVCPDEVITQTVFVGKLETQPFPNIQSTREALQAKINAIQAGVTKEVVQMDVGQLEDWRFTPDKPQFHDDGKTYRQQKLAPAFKAIRTVEVDADDHESIIRIK